MWTYGTSSVLAPQLGPAHELLKVEVSAIFNIIWISGCKDPGAR